MFNGLERSESGRSANLGTLTFGGPLAVDAAGQVSGNVGTVEGIGKVVGTFCVLLW